MTTKKALMDLIDLAKDTLERIDTDTKVKVHPTERVGLGHGPSFHDERIIGVLLKDNESLRKENESLRNQLTECKCQLKDFVKDEPCRTIQKLKSEVRQLEARFAEKQSVVETLTKVRDDQAELLKLSESSLKEAGEDTRFWKRMYYEQTDISETAIKKLEALRATGREETEEESF